MVANSWPWTNALTTIWLMTGCNNSSLEHLKSINRLWKEVDQDLRALLTLLTKLFSTCDQTVYPRAQAKLIMVPRWQMAPITTSSYKQKTNKINNKMSSNNSAVRDHLQEFSSSNSNRRNLLHLSIYRIKTKITTCHARWCTLMQARVRLTWEKMCLQMQLLGRCMHNSWITCRPN